jgi:uncharacterized membrane protein HdeD (DUF308 family)
MLDALTQRWWVVALRGVAAVIFGILALVWPAITLGALVLLFGAYALVDGVCALWTAATGGPAASGRRPWLVLEGVAGVAAGIVTFVWPDITALALLAVIAAWALVTGVLEIVGAVRLRREIEGEWLMVLSGVLSVVFGILLIINPAAGALAVTWLIGAYAIVFGAVLLGLAMRLYRLRQHEDQPRGTRPAHA